MTSNLKIYLKIGLTRYATLCEVRPGKKDPNRTRITICGTNVCYPGDVGTNTASLEIFKLMINSILSRAGAKYV